MAGAVRVVDKGYAALFKRLSGKMAQVTVGVHEDAGARPHSDKPKSPTIAEVATWLEFGTAKAPRRSIVSDWADQNEDVNKGLMRKLSEGVVTGKVANAEQACHLLGEKLKGSMVRRYGEGIPPPNAPSTVEHKGSSLPGIDTGTVRKAIDFKVT